MGTYQFDSLQIFGSNYFGICVVGAYSSRNTMFDVWVAIGAGILGLYNEENQLADSPPHLRIHFRTFV